MAAFSGHCVPHERYLDADKLIIYNFLFATKFFSHLLKSIRQ
jgi:hypothetical protein